MCCDRACQRPKWRKARRVKSMDCLRPSYDCDFAREGIPLSLGFAYARYVGHGTFTSAIVVLSCLGCSAQRTPKRRASTSLPADEVLPKVSNSSI
jgi:hypothetical protein